MSILPTREDRDERALQLAAGVYLLILGLKLLAYFGTGITALLAEALHTLSDIFVSGFLLVATLWSRKEADEVYMFGYGRAQNVAALVAATLLISFTSLRLYEEAFAHLQNPSGMAHRNLSLAVGVLVASMLVSAVPLANLLRQRRRGATAKAQMLELVNDELGLLAALLATLFIAWGHPIADPLATAAVATIIAVNALILFWENASLLLGRSPGPEFLSEVERVACSVPGVLGVHDLRATYTGPDTIYVAMHVQVWAGQRVEDADRISENVAERVRQQTGADYVIVHLDTVNPHRHQ